MDDFTPDPNARRVSLRNIYEYEFDQIVAHYERRDSNGYGYYRRDS